jgi:hypothetical protein
MGYGVGKIDKGTWEYSVSLGLALDFIMSPLTAHDWMISSTTSALRLLCLKSAFSMLIVY